MELCFPFQLCCLCFPHGVHVAVHRLCQLRIPLRSSAMAMTIGSKQTNTSKAEIPRLMRHEFSFLDCTMLISAC